MQGIVSDRNAAQHIVTRTVSPRCKLIILIKHFHKDIVIKHISFVWEGSDYLMAIIHFVVRQKVIPDTFAITASYCNIWIYFPDIIPRIIIHFNEKAYFCIRNTKSAISINPSGNDTISGVVQSVRVTVGYLHRKYIKCRILLIQSNTKVVRFITANLSPNSICLVIFHYPLFS